MPRSALVACFLSVALTSVLCLTEKPLVKAGPPLIKTAWNIATEGPTSTSDDDGESDEGHKLTTERLAFILIGSCCGLSILCLVVVATTLRCKERCKVKQNPAPVLKESNWSKGVPRTLHAPLRREHPAVPPNFRFNGSSSSCDSCKCTCETWSLGPRNLTTTLPSRNPFGQQRVFGKKLPFGAGSTLHFGAPPPPRRPFVSGCVLCRCAAGNNSTSQAETLTSDTSASTSSDEFPQCTCIDPPKSQRRRTEGQWDLSPDSLEPSDEAADGPSWRTCSYLVDTLHRHHSRFPSSTAPARSWRGRSYVAPARASSVFWTSSNEKLI